SQTEGNPLFVREVVRFLAQEGHFNTAATGAAPPPVIRLPEGVREVIGRRLNLLPAECNEILATAAVIGREFTLDVLVRAHQPRGAETVLEALDEALAAHVIEETSPGLYQFTHALVRITLYDELRTGQRRRLHHNVAEAMEAVHRRDPTAVLADLAHHFRAAGLSGDVERAIDYATRAGQGADAALAFEDAINLFQNALDLLDTLPDTLGTDDAERRCNLMVLLGDAQRKANDHPQALDTLHAAAGIALSRGLPVLLARSAVLFADTDLRHTALMDKRAGPLLEAAAKAVPENETGLRIVVLASLARHQLHTGRLDGSKTLLSQAITMARRLGDPAALAASMVGLADYPCDPRETEQMLAEATEMAEVGERANNLEVASRGHFRRVALLLELGDIRGAVAAARMMGRVAAQLRQPFFTLFELGMKATLALMRGALDEAELLILQAARTRLPHRAYVTDPASMLIFTLRREQGRLRELRPLVAMFLRQSPEAGIWRPGLALLHVELGDLEPARAVFEELAADD